LSSASFILQNGHFGEGLNDLECARNAVAGDQMGRQAGDVGSFEEDLSGGLGHEAGD
jgi:hypothetical protein